MFISERVVGGGLRGDDGPVAGERSGAGHDSEGAAAAPVDMLSKGRRDFGPHFTPKMPPAQGQPSQPAARARGAGAQGQAEPASTGLESLRKALRGPHRH